MEVASLSLEVKSGSVKESTVALREMVPAASAAERAAQRWGMSTSQAARASEDFSKRVQRTIRDLEFERQQLTRSAAEKQRYSLLRRAGVSEASAEGRAISASVAALQAQRAALEQNSAAAVKSRSALEPLVGYLRVFASIQGAQRLGSMVLEAAENYTRFANSLKVAGVAGENLAGVQDRLLSAANRHGVEIEALGQLYGRLTLSGKELGASQTDMLKFVDGVTAALRVQGGSTQQASGALLQLSQALGSGIVRAEEFNSILEGAQPIAQAAARGMDGVNGSVAKLRTMIVDGKVTSQAFFAAMMRGFEQTEAAALNANRTVGQSLTSLNNSWTVFIGGLDQATGATRTLADLINTFAGRIEYLGKVARTSRVDLLTLLNIVANPGGAIGIALGAQTPAEKIAADIEKQRKAVEAKDAAFKANPTIFGMRNKRAEADLAAAREQLSLLERQQMVLKAGGAATRSADDPDNVGITLPPRPQTIDTKKKGGSDPYAKAIESAREYILTKKAEIAAVGENVLVAARLKHEQELLNKAQNDGKVLNQAQIVELKNLASAMAEADNALATAKFTDDAKTKSADFIAAQEMEQQALFMSAEAADALRFSTEMLNEAKRAGIELAPEQVDAIKQSADAMAAAKARTDEWKEIVGLGREVFKGFFSDLRDGLNNGVTLWEAFGNAALNALNRIAEKLMEMAATKMFEQAFGGSGGGGGFLGGLFGSIFGGGGVSAVGGGFNIGAASAMPGGFMPGFANGAAFRAGNVIPFASGGIVGSPTMFPMSRGRTGLMGEAGPEAILPLRRGPNGSLGVQMHGGGAANENTTVIVNQTVHVGEFVTTQQFAAGMRNVKKSAEEGAQSALINRKKRGGLQDVF